jgi:hypothetical protein
MSTQLRVVRIVGGLMLRLLVPLVALLTCALSSAAVAAPPWSPVIELDPGGPATSTASLSFDADGGALASWPAWDVNQRRIRFQRLTSELALDGGVQTMDGVVAGPVAYGHGRAVAVRAAAVRGSQYTATARLEAVDGSTTGFGRFHVPVPPALAVSPAGDTVVAWIERRTDNRARLWLTTRRAGGRFERPQVVRVASRMTALAVAINASGRFVVTWRRFALAGARRVRTIEARTGQVARSLSPLAVLAPINDVGRDVVSMAAVVAPTGRTTVVWSSDFGGEATPYRQAVVQASVMPASASRFRSAVVIDTGTPGEPARLGPSVAAAADGTTTIAYSLNLYGGAAGALVEPVRVATQDATARFGPPLELSTCGVAGALAVRGDGATIVPVLRCPGRSGLDAMVAGPGQLTFHAESIDESSPFLGAAAAFAPGPAGSPAVVFSGGVVRFSARAGL